MNNRGSQVGIEVVPAAVEDLDGLAALGRLFYEEATPAWSYDESAAIGTWRGWLEDDAMGLFVARDRGAVVGAIIGRVYRNPYADHMEWLGIGLSWYVAPAARGYGLGRGLFEALEAWCRARGAILLAHKVPARGTAGALLGRLGYTPTQQEFEKRWTDG